MRNILFALVAVLALLSVGSRGDEVEEQVEVDSQYGFDEVEVRGDEEGLDFAAILSDLFDSEKDDDEVVPGSAREARAEEGDEEKASGNEEDLTRYNNFIDTVIRRINSYARSRFDPLTFGLTKKNSKGGKGGNDKGRRDVKAGKGKKGKGGKKRGKGNKKGKKGKGKKGNKKGGKRHPKDLDLDEVAEGQAAEGEEQHETVSVVEEEGENRQKREAGEEEEEEEEDGEEEEEEGEGEEGEEEEEEGEVAREGRDLDVDALKAPGKAGEVGRRGNTKKGNRRGSNRGGNNKKGKKSGKKGGKKGGKKKGGKKGKKGSSKSRTSRAAVNGIASLRRVGDVKVVNIRDGKEIRTQFALGPVDLKVSRKYGKGKTAEVRNARATSPELKGKMYIHVSPQGRAKVTKFFITRPSIVRVDGSLRKGSTPGQKSTVMNKSLHRATPFAMKKLKIAAREVLSSSQPRS